MSNIQFEKYCLGTVWSLLAKQYSMYFVNMNALSSNLVQLEVPQSFDARLGELLLWGTLLVW